MVFPWIKLSENILWNLFFFHSRKVIGEDLYLSLPLKWHFVLSLFNPTGCIGHYEETDVIITTLIVQVQKYFHLHTTQKSPHTPLQDILFVNRLFVYAVSK